MDKKLDFSKICRTCLLQINNNMSSVFSQNILDMLNVCTNVKISKYDGLPDQICCKCVENVKVSYDFKIQSEKCDKLLHKFVNENANEIQNLVIIKAEGTCATENACDKRSNVVDDEQYLSEDLTSFLEIKDEIKNEIKDEIKNSADYDENDFDNESNRDEDFATKSSNKRNEEDKNFTYQNVQNKSKKKYDCEHCSMIFYELSSLAKHLKIQHHVKPVECQVCQKNFTLQLQLDYHMRIHGKKKFICKFCGKEVRKSAILKAHELSHTDEDPHPCPHCRKLFKHRPSLNWHIRRAHRGERKKDVCTICGVEVLHLKHHNLRKHPTERPFKCNECDQAFGVEWALKEHKKKHTAEYKEPKKLCTICGKKSHTATALIYHMRTHTGESPFQCTICGKATKTNGAMVAHKRTHTGERPYECPTCHRRFTTSACAKKHQLIHTGERPYECNLCGRPFRQKSALRTHMKIH